MHATLQPWFNAIVVLFWLGVAASVAAFAPTPPSFGVAAAVAIGLLAGLLRNSAVSRQRPQLQTATTATQVRAALLSTAPGKASVALSWALLVCLILLTAGDRFGTLSTVVCSFAAFQAARDITSLLAVVKLSHGVRQ